MTLHLPMATNSDVSTEELRAMLDPLITEGVCGKSGKNDGVQGGWVAG